MHKSSILAFCLILPVASLVSLTGCNASRHDPNEKYYLVSVNLKVPYWQTMATGLARSAREMGVLAEAVGPDTYDPSAERDAFRKAVAAKPAGIMVSAADPKLMKDEIDGAIAQGIPVITVDSDVPDSKRLTFIGTNNYQAGLMGGRLAAKLLGGKGDVVIYTMPGQVNLDERLQGYRNAFADHPQIKITQIVDVKGDPRVAFDTTMDILNKGKVKPDAWVCLAGTSCPEVADVLDRNKVTGKVVVAMDTSQDTLGWIKKGMIAATIAQKPFTMGFYGLKMLDDLHHNKPANLAINWANDSFAPIPAFVDTGSTLITSANLEAFQKAQTPAAGK